MKDDQVLAELDLPYLDLLLVITDFDDTECRLVLSPPFSKLNGLRYVRKKEIGFRNIEFKRKPVRFFMGDNPMLISRIIHL